MSLLNDKLSALKAGMMVRLTHTGGQIIEGIIAENDGAESLSVQITSMTTLRYDQISMMDEMQQSGTIMQVQQVPQSLSAAVAPKQAPPAPVSSVLEVMKPIADKETVQACFKALESEERKALTPAHDKFQSYLKSHENSKFQEAIELIWKIMGEQGWDDNPRVNQYFAMLNLMFGDVYSAAISFFYSGDLRSAYCTAFHCTRKEDEKDLYQLAAAFSAIYLLDKNPLYAAEAAEVLKKSSVMGSDVSGVEYLFTSDVIPKVDKLVQEMIRSLASNYVKTSAEAENLDVLLAKLRINCPEKSIVKKITDFLERMPVPEADPDSEPAPEKEPEKEPEKKEFVPDTEQIYDGKITAYKFYEESGVIENGTGEKFAFELKSITDASLTAQMKKISTREIKPIRVKFQLKKQGGKFVAHSIKRGLESKPAPAPAPAVSYDTMAGANALYNQKKYENAIEVYRRFLSSSDWEAAFTQIIMCYLALWNENGDLGYSEELTAFVEKYVDQTTKNTKTLEVLQQYYMRIQNYEECIRILNDLMDLCEPEEHGRILHYRVGMERCYRFLKDYPNAISQLLDWLDIVKRCKLKERYPQRDTLTYIELAELYYENSEYDNAERYAKLSTAAERKQSLLEKLAAKREEQMEADYMGYSDIDDMDADDEEGGSSAEDTEESLQTAYEGYQDKAGFDALGKTDEQILRTALGFRQLHCVLTYLHTAAVMGASTEQTRTDADGKTVFVGHALEALDQAFGFAFSSPLADRNFDSTEIISVFAETQHLMPGINSRLFASAALHSLFQNPSIPDYTASDLAIVVEDSHLEQFPALTPLVERLLEFREKTGCGMDIYADYKTSGAAVSKIIAEAASCCNAADLRNDVYESHGQVRRTREFIFSDKSSELRICLDAVAANETDRYQFIKEKMEELFIRSNKPITPENIDNKKIDKYIDRHWDLARDAIQSEGRHISRPHDKLKGSKRNNIVTTVRRIISCICDWLAAAEHSSGNDNIFARSQYDQLAPQVMTGLNELLRSCGEWTAEHGFDWGTESLRRTAAELLAKMDGSYDSRTRKYLFIEFLNGEEILLNDSCLPEIHSTFCDMPEFNILRRIERHAEKTHPTLAERISEILSDTETKHNFRSARLIRSYAEDMELTEITEHKDLAQFGECHKQARQRFETMYRDFSDELELCESYGTLSNINGEKTQIMELALQWYRITRLTNDYGFFARMLQSIRSRISSDAAEKGERLMRQLEELADKTEYDFGVYSKDMIATLINDQNYSSAEFILNCIRRGDTKAVTDYSAEPFGYFSEFVSEHATNYRAVHGAGKSLIETIFSYSGRKDAEKALMQLTNNARKETKGGASLIKSWMPKGGPANPENLEKLLSRLGFKPVSIQPDTTIDAEAYHVLCRKQIGKVSYIHRIPAFGSQSEQEGFRILCLYGKYDCNSLMDKFRSVNTTAKHTLVLLDYALNIEERRKLARKIKEEKSFSKTFIVVDRVILFYLAKHYAENTIIKRLMAVTLPFAYYQPFVESSTQTMPPELFTGREAELTSIESAEGANLVYGGRQLGKSALLKMAMHNIDRNANGDRAILLDIKDRSSAEAAGLVSNELILTGILDESCRCDNWAVLAGHLKKRLMDEDPETRINYLLIMLDEADEFIKTSGETDDPPISALKNLPSNRFKLVMAGLHNLSRYNREMMHLNSNLIHLNSVVIKQFRREEAIKLLTNILAYLGFRFNEQIISNILASTNYYPGLIQFYCQKLLEAMKNEDYAGYSEIRTPNYEVTESHFKKVLSDSDFMDKVNEKLEATLFTEEKGRSNYHIIALIFAFLCYTDPKEKGYTMADLLKIAEEYHITRLTSLRSEQFSEILNEMWDLNVLTKMDDCYSFATEGFRNLLGSQEKVELAMADYFGEGESV